MFRKWMVFLLCTLLLFSSALAEGELRGYSKEDGYVYVSFGRYPQVIDGGIPDDGTQAWSWRVSYQQNKVKGEMREEGIDPAAIEPTPILWRVLSVEVERAYLCTEYILFPHPLQENSGVYAKIGEDFGQTELCAYLNSEFAKTAFTPEELRMLLSYKTYGKIFLLSADDLKDKSMGFGTNKSRKAWATEYSIRACGGFVYQVSKGSPSPYWTRTQSTSHKNAGRCTKQDGDVGYYDATNPEEGVRPAVWLYLNGFDIESGSGTKTDPYVLVPKS